MRVRTLFLMLFLIPALAHAGPYVFPVTSDSPGWVDLTVAERIAAMQVPEDTLAVMTTEDVYLTYITCPMIMLEVTGTSPPQVGFDEAREQYNIISTLMERPDVIEVVMDRYLAFVIDETTYDDFWYQVRVDITQFVLEQDELVALMDSDEKRAILAKALSINDIKLTLPGSFWFAHQGCILAGRILVSETYPPLMEKIALDPAIQTALDRASGYIPYSELLFGFAREYLASTGIAKDSAPVTFNLFPAYPNPFNPSTTISYAIPASGRVTLSVYSVSGQKVATLVDDVQEAGSHSVVFDGRGLASGIYVYRLETNGSVISRKMMLIK